MPLLPVVYHHAPMGQPEPAPIVSPHVPRPILYVLYPLLGSTSHVNKYELLIL